METKKKSWPNFANWSQGLWQGNEDQSPSKQLDAALYLVATPIGNLGDITLRALWVLAHADAILCEDTRETGQLLSLYGIKKPLLSCHDHNEEARTKEIITRIKGGEALALVSDAGTPLLSDPGFKVARACGEVDVPVFAVPGASALLTALSISGLPTDQFAFIGFLPNKQQARQKRLAQIARDYTSVYYEAPQRLAATLTDMAEVYGGDRKAVVTRELTKLYEEKRTGTLSELADYYAATPIKGEIVILLAPEEAHEPTEEDIDAAIKEALTSMSVKDAAAHVSEALGMKKKPIYQRALTIKATIDRPL